MPWAVREGSDRSVKRRCGGGESFLTHRLSRDSAGPPDGGVRAHRRVVVDVGTVPGGRGSGGKDESILIPLSSFSRLCAGGCRCASGPRDRLRHRRGGRRAHIQVVRPGSDAGAGHSARAVARATAGAKAADGAETRAGHSYARAAAGRSAAGAYPCAGRQATSSAACPGAVPAGTACPRSCPVTDDTALAGPRAGWRRGR
jgi:hypothetical protein